MCSSDLKLSHLTSVKQKLDESVSDYVRRFRDTKNRCYGVTLSKWDMADLVLNGLRSHLKERMEGLQFLTVGPVLQRALVQESRANEVKETHRLTRPRVNAVEYGLESDEEADVYSSEFVWPSKAKPYVCDDLKPIRPNRLEELKCTFDVAKCDRIFDAMLRD